jgi:hypothetical protein
MGVKAAHATKNNKGVIKSMFSYSVFTENVPVNGLQFHTPYSKKSPWSAALLTAFKKNPAK